MAQLRLTKKFALDCKIKSLQTPSLTTEPLDDWIMDVIRVHRKKVAMVTHVKTLFTVFVPYSSIGGAKNIARALPTIIGSRLKSYQYPFSQESLQEIFNRDHIYCKTDNRKVLGHLNDFKRCIEPFLDEPYEYLNWDHLSNKVNNIITNVNSIGYTHPYELMSNLLNHKGLLQ